MIKSKLKFKRNQDHLFQTDKKITKKVITGSIIATIIASTPFLYSLHEGVPQTKVWNTFLFTYDSNFWKDANYAMWVFTSKLIPLLLLFLWFFTCRHWWYHALLVPIAMYISQTFATYNSESEFMDEFQFIYLLPVMAIVIPSIYLIRARMFSKITEEDKTMQELEDEFKIGPPKNFMGRLKDYF
ncbi:hypothetical protein [Mangrovimonas sp. YM274]|uniref:hypothetical protein n=1 Tax=Mangrovimonas sp. YM274 TaxID=3070660 RepID=UPI0027DC1DDF|nr:hypothetical protein [Mangrovimonas sp. YM274]WMI67279.1 hypothetical protein RBH95_08980 [Mangrovimonas sp. YM274]